jgi:hypothetical protein
MSEPKQRISQHVKPALLDDKLILGAVMLAALPACVIRYFHYELTAASGEQSDGIGQGNLAVSQLDQVTHQNAVLVEESSAATQSLKDQALSLARAIQVFSAGSNLRPA